MRSRNVVAVLLAAVLSVLVSAMPASADTTRQLDRLAGKDRYATAATISASTFQPGVSVAYVASGAQFADALAGAAAAGASSAPVLLTNPTVLPDSVRAELTRLKPQKIVVLGGRGAVSAGVERSLAGLTSGPVQRLAGKDRFVTAASISASTFRRGANTVYLASGRDYPDALAGAAAAGAQDAPVLLVDPNVLPTAVRAELQRLSPQRVVVLGGTKAVSGQVEQAAQAATGAQTSRLAGKDRYATATAVATSTGGAISDSVYLASGQQFPDALAGASAAAVRGSRILLAAPTVLPTVARQAIDRSNPSRVVVLGGTGAISARVADEAAGATEVAASASSGSFATERNGLTKKLNDYRKQNGAAALPRHSHLDKLAQDRAKWMGENKKLEHTPDLKAKMGSGWIVGSEIIVRHTWPGSMNTDQILNYMHGWWRGSPVHNTNMLRKAWNDRYTVTHVGTGFYRNAEGQVFGVHVFGAAR